VAISNQRLLAVTERDVRFQWKDYRHQHKEKSREMTVAIPEFIRRFLLHTLPPGFQRIRHFGFLANCHRKEKLALCRQFLAAPVTQLLPAAPAYQQWHKPPASREVLPKCRHCGIGVMRRVQILPPYRWPGPAPDTS
jgi:hypothetical protein